MELFKDLSHLNATVFSAFLGFLGGTVINHWLANRRYDRARHDRFIDICQSLIGEMSYLCLLVAQVRDEDELHGDDKIYTIVSLEEFENPENTFYGQIKNDLGFLGWETVLSIRAFYVEYKSISRVISKNAAAGIYDIDEGLAKLIEQLCRDQSAIENILFKEQRNYLRFLDRMRWLYGDFRSWRYMKKNRAIQSRMNKFSPSR